MRYRTLKIRRPLADFAEEERKALVSVLKGVKALSKLIKSGYAEVTRAIAEVRGLKYFYNELMYFKDHNNGHAKFDCQVRVDKERDRSKGVFIDLPKGELRLRRIIPGYAIVIKLNRKEVRYIRQRLEEGGRLTFAEAWVDGEYLYIALSFRRDVELIRPKKLIVVDVNALHHGFTVALVGENGVEEVREYKAPVERVYATLERARVWKRFNNLLKKSRNAERKAKKFTKKAYNIVRDFVNKTAHEVVEMARKHEAEIWIDTPFDETVRKLYRTLPPHAKVLLAGMRRFAKRVEEQATWYGVPTRRVTLSSTKCPRCSAKLVGLESRRMRCPACGFEEDRDRVPIHWALKWWNEKKAKLSASATASAVTQANTTTKNSPEPPSFSPILVATALS
ncbi:MAG: transposase [Pyrobaculum sp.]